MANIPSLKPTFDSRFNSARMNPFVYVGKPELMADKRMKSAMAPNGVSGTGISDVGHSG